MARPATGQVIEREGKQGRTFALRFRAGDRARAEQELSNVMADVRRGIWKPPAPEPVREAEPTFHEFASEWLEAMTPGLAQGTVDRYRWQLTDHLLPVFARHRLSAITVAEVDRYRDAKMHA